MQSLGNRFLFAIGFGLSIIFEQDRFSFQYRVNPSRTAFQWVQAKLGAERNDLDRWAGVRALVYGNRGSNNSQEH